MAKRVVLDTNLCTLLRVGLTERAFIKRHTRLRAFDEADFDLLTRYLQRAGTLTFILAQHNDRGLKSPSARD